jgi:peptide/nickel transport system permease protein
MNVAAYALRRLLLIVPTLLGVTLLTFALSRLVPGDPARLAAGAQATPEMYEQIRREFGLDQPLPAQYWGYLTGLFQGDWGRSILSRRSVIEDLQTYWPATLELVLVAMAIATLVGVPLGVVSAVRADRPVDQASRLVSLVGVSVPAFWLAVLLQLFFGLRLGWLPVSGRLGSAFAAPPHLTGLYLVDAAAAGQWATFGDAARQLVLPALTLSFPALATIARFTRASLLETLGQDYVRTARAKGVAERRVVLGHALRNALIPTITMIGLSFGWSMGGSVLVETVFDWPGIGLYATKSALTLDFSPIMGIALLYGLVFSLINIGVDLTYGLLDPRIARGAA